MFAPPPIFCVQSGPVVMSPGDASDHSRRVSVLCWDQVRRLDSILGESVPIHGRGNFPTLSVQPRQIVQVSPPPELPGVIPSDPSRRKTSRF